MVKPLAQAEITGLAQLGGHLDLQFDGAEDVKLQQGQFLPSNCLMVNSPEKPKPFSEFSASLRLPNDVTIKGLALRVVQIIEYGPEPGFMVQLLSGMPALSQAIERYLAQTAPAEPKIDNKRKRRLSIQDKLKGMNPTERAILASKADALTRAVLIRDREPQVMLFLLKNPRTTRAEVLDIAKSSAVNHQVVQLICRNRQWMQSEDLRYNLVMNPKSPLPVVLKILPNLSQKHLRDIAKNHHIKTQIKRAALRIVVERYGR